MMTFNVVKAMVLGNTSHVFRSIPFLLVLEAFSPAVDRSVTLIITELQSFDASRVMFTSLFLLFAVFFYAFFRTSLND